MEGINPFMNTVKLDQVTPGANSVTLATGTYSAFGSSFISFTRPANAIPYAAGDVVGDTGGAQVRVFINVSTAVPITGVQINIRGASLRIDQSAPIPVGVGIFLLHLYDDLPTGIADNAPFDLIAADRGKYQGYITLISPIGLGSTIFSQSDQGLIVKLAASATGLWGILQTVNAYTPTASAVHNVTLYPNLL